jgi:hypothetical protein
VQRATRSRPQSPTRVCSALQGHPPTPMHTTNSREGNIAEPMRFGGPTSVCVARSGAKHVQCTTALDRAALANTGVISIACYIVIFPSPLSPPVPSPPPAKPMRVSSTLPPRHSDPFAIGWRGHFRPIFLFVVCFLPSSVLHRRRAQWAATASASSLSPPAYTVAERSGPQPRPRAVSADGGPEEIVVATVERQTSSSSRQCSGRTVEHTVAVAVRRRPRAAPAHITRAHRPSLQVGAAQAAEQRVFGAAGSCECAAKPSSHAPPSNRAGRSAQPGEHPSARCFFLSVAIATADPPPSAAFSGVCSAPAPCCSRVSSAVVCCVPRRAVEEDGSKEAACGCRATPCAATQEEEEHARRRSIGFCMGAQSDTHCVCA